LFNIEIPLPNKNSRIKILKIHLKDRPIDEKVNIKQLAEDLEGYTGADIKGVCEEAAILAIRRGVFDTNIDVTNPDSYMKFKISQEEFERAIEKVKKGADKAKQSYKESIKTVEDIYR
jgi:transitional endoplasmic reticulum ATPase